MNKGWHLQTLLVVLLAMVAMGGQQWRCNSKERYLKDKCFGQGFCVGDVESLSSKMGRKCLRKSTYLSNKCGIEEDDYPTKFDCLIKQTLLLENVNGEWEEWDEWTECSTTCGTGSRSRAREYTAPRNNGLNPTNFPDGNSEEGFCAEDECPVDGGVGTWSSWTPCSKLCGGGSQSRERSCDNPTPKNGGKDCDASQLEETNRCNTEQCKVDGGVGTWSSWTPCTKLCEGGTQSRERSCDNPAPKNGGKDCDASQLEETNRCNTEECEILLFENDKYGGTSHKATESISYVKNYNDKIGSVKVTKGNWILYKDAKHKGKQQIVCEDDNINRMDYDDEISSIKITHDPQPVCDYELKVFVGDEETPFKASDGFLKEKNLNDNITKVMSVKGHWRVYKNDKFGGDKYAICNEETADSKILKDLAKEISSIKRLTCCPKTDSNCKTSDD